MPKVLVSALSRDEAATARLLSGIKRFVPDLDGHFWTDDLAKMAWSGPKDLLLTPDCALWLISGRAEDLATDSVRQGLALTALGVQAAKGQNFPIILALSGALPDPAALPTPLSGAEILAVDNPALGPKLTAKAFTPRKAVPLEYRLDVYALPGLGLWLEAGPGAGHHWAGAMIGTEGGDIFAHGVGPSGKLPERSVVEYAMKGLKLGLGGREFTAWAVQNALEPGISYYVGLRGDPKALVFGSLPEGDEAEVYSVKLA